MGRTPTNRGRIGIQPVPIDDLKLQGYVPKTLYVPDDIPVGVCIIAGMGDNETRIPKVDSTGNLLTGRSYVQPSAIGTTLFRLVQPITTTDISTTGKLSLPLAGGYVLSLHVSPLNTDIGDITCDELSYDYGGEVTDDSVLGVVNQSSSFNVGLYMAGSNKTTLQEFIFTPTDTSAEYTYLIDIAINVP